MSLEQELKSLITETGPISIAKFMEEALSHPKYGYYHTCNPFGKSGDFITAPEVSQIFGELIGIWCATNWVQMGQPKDVALVELGPGLGTLMDDLLRATKHVAGFHDALDIYMVETSPVLKVIQQKRLESIRSKVTWCDTVDDIPNKPLLLVANEFFDALPIHQYIYTNAKWHERVVGFNDNGEFMFGIASSPKQHQTKLEIKDKSIIELPVIGRHISEIISSHVVKYGGASLIIDYGYSEPGYGDTLQAVSNHKYHSVLENVGTVDVTSHVNFPVLKDVAIGNGASVVGPVSQSEFLQTLGLDLRLETLQQHANKEQKEQLQLGVERLIDKKQMGNLFKVMTITEPTLEHLFIYNGSEATE